VTNAVSGLTFANMAVLDPKSKSEVAGLLVVQLMVTDVLAMTLVRFEITGGLISSVDEGAGGGAGSAGGGVCVDT
jgi:hypothetical protein